MLPAFVPTAPAAPLSASLAPAASRPPIGLVRSRPLVRLASLSAPAAAPAPDKGDDNA